MLERDAEELGASYVTSVLRRRHVLELVAEKLGTAAAATQQATVIPGPAEIAWHLESDPMPAPPATPTRRVLH